MLHSLFRITTWSHTLVYSGFTEGLGLCLDMCKITKSRLSFAIAIMKESETNQLCQIHHAHASSSTYQINYNVSLSFPL